MIRSRTGWPRARAILAVSLVMLAGAAHADSPSEATTYRFERSLTPSAAGPIRVNVDVPLLSGAEPGAGLRDLRFTAETGREVPYLLVAPREAPPDTWLKGVVARIPDAGVESGFEVDLGRVVDVDRLRIAGVPRPFLKSARVEGSGDRSRYTVLVPQVTLFDLPSEQLVGLEVPIHEGLERYLRVTWDNHATPAPPLPDAVSVREVTPTTPPEPLRADVPFERRPSRTGESHFRIHLPAPHLPVVALELSCGGGHLLRAARVLEPELRGDEVVPVELGHATLRRSMHDGLSASSLSIPVGSAPGADLDLTVDDGDNPPLDLTHVSAVLAPEPWIYLEVSSTTPLVAHYGNAKLTAPHYDLEAARAGLDKLHPTSATWGIPRTSNVRPPAAEPPPAVSLVGATLDPAGFTLSRTISPGKKGATGLAAVSLDDAVLAHSATFADLRILDATGHQVPFLLEHQGEPTLVELKLEPEGKDVPEGPHVEPKTSLYRVVLPYASLPEGRLVLSTSTRVFQRRISLLAARAANASPRDPEVRTLATHDWTHADADSAAPALALPLGNEGTTTIYVRVDEGDNTALALTGAHLELPGLRLRFFHAADASLTLLYGNPTLAPPRYDLALLAPTLAGAVAEELTLGPETKNTSAAPPPATGMLVFWGVLVGAVVILFVMMGLLLRRDGSATP